MIQQAVISAKFEILPPVRSLIAVCENRSLRFAKNRFEKPDAKDLPRPERDKFSIRHQPRKSFLTAKLFGL